MQKFKLVNISHQAKHIFYTELIYLSISSLSIGLDDLEKKRLQQAYVIAVEQQTRDKIAQIAAHNNVQTVDLTSLNNSNHPVGITNGHTHVELHGHSNGYPEPEHSASEPQEPPLTATSATVPQDGYSNERLSQLFGDDFQAVSEPDGYDNPAFSLEFPSTGSDISASETETAHRAGSLPIQEPAVQPKVLKGEEVPPVDLAKLDVQSNAQSASLPTSSTQQRNIMPEPSAAVRVEAHPREMGVDCPADFVAASGMKDPPAQSAGSAKVNGHTLTNGTDLIPNSKHNNNMSYDNWNSTGTHNHPGVTIQQVRTS